MNKTSIKLNLIYNTMYQILVVFVPLITSPYIARTLGAKNIGINSWTYSIAFYFMIFAMLGINNYGNRTIAAVRNDKYMRSKIFCEIYLCQLIMGIVMTLLYLVFVTYGVKEYTNIFFFQGLFIVANIFDVTWYFYGIENFKVTVYRNTVVKLLGLFLIFILVKNSNDLWIYTLINAGTTLIGQMLIWPYLLKDIRFQIPSIKSVCNHCKPIIILFIPVLAISVFTYMDKYMIGKMSSLVQSGFYESTDKIISVPKAIITALGTVMLPRTAYLIANDQEEKSREYMDITMMLTMVLSSAFMFGMASVSDVFSVVFWGEDFLECGKLIAFISPAIVFSVIGNVVRTQYLIPRSRDKEYTISLIIGAIVNFFINLLLISPMGALGAVIGTVIAELVMTTIQFLYVKNEIDYKNYFKQGYLFFVFGAFMYMIVTILKSFMNKDILSLILLIVIGGSVYLLLVIPYLVYSKKTFIREMNKILLNSKMFKNFKNNS